MPEQEQEKGLTTAEAFNLSGRLMQRLGARLEDPETPDKITRSEWMSLVQETVVDAWSEFND